MAVLTTTQSGPSKTRVERGYLSGADRILLDGVSARSGVGRAQVYG
jgi:hypothetical protein